jgi:photosystem II stability/assembly factor-like uncharacterized protein
MRSISRLTLFLATLATVLPVGSRALFGQDQDAGQQTPEAAKAAADKFEDEGEGKEGDFIRKRMAWFHDQRAYPNKTIPPGIRQRAVKERDAKVALESSLRHLLASANTQPAASLDVPWTPIGPQPLGTSNPDAGRVTALAIDPANPKIIYLGSAQGGVWKTVDGGTIWTPLTDSQVSMSVGAITLDPSNPNTIYVGTGEENFSGDSYYGAGILKSTNAGKTWTQLVGTFAGGPCGGDWIGAIAVHPTNSLILLAAVESCYYGYGGIYRSVDGGASWTAVLEPSSWVPFTAVLFDPVNPNFVYAATYNDGIFKSTDGGIAWNAANGTGSNALPTSNLGRIALAMTPSNPSILYAAVEDSSNYNLLGLYKTVDGAANWSLLPNAPNFCSTQCWYDIVLAVSPTNANLVVAGGVYTYHPGGSAITTSLDGGMTWADQSPGLHPDTHALAFSPDGSTLYTGDDGGVWSTSAPAANPISWTNLNSSLAITEFYPGISMDQGNLNHSLVGTQDNGTDLYVGTPAWNQVACGDGGSTLIDFAETNTLYTNCIELTLNKSTDNGNYWVSVTTGMDTSDRTGWVPPLAMDPMHDQTLYFGTYRVYQTTNGASLWTAISGDLTGTSGRGVLSTIAVAPTDPSIVYAGSNDGRVHVTTNALAATGAQWTDVTSYSLPGRSVNWIAVDPTSATTAYVGFSGFTGYGDLLGHIFKTTNAGTTWTDISSDLPNTPVDAILVDPDAPGTIFIGTDIGAFYTTNSGAGWSKLGTGLPNVVVTGLGFHEGTHTLRASTHGRSVWDLNVVSLIPVPAILSLSPTALTADSAATRLTVGGTDFNSKSVVIWNKTPLTTTFENSHELAATVPAADLTNGGTATISVMNGAGGRLSKAVTVIVDNPTPKLLTLSVRHALAGSAALRLTIGGSGFVTSSKVLWHGKAVATTYGGKSLLSATIPASDLAAAGTASVAVANPIPGGGTSAQLLFTIDDPVPVATALSPTSAKAGGASFTLAVTGSKFVRGSKVHWNGTALATTYSSQSKLAATVTAADIVKATTASITVSNPAPGGGNSTSIKFPVH